MKKIYSLLATTIVAVTIAAQTTVLTENFSDYSAGTISSPSGQDVYANSSNVTTFPEGTKVYSAAGMAKLGTASLAGSMTTGNLNLSTNGGNVRVSFDVTGWTTIESPIVVTVGTVSKEVSFTALRGETPQSKWVEFSSVGTNNMKVTIATKTKRAYIDNVKIETYTTSLATIDISSKKINLVKNTIVSNELIFGASAKVSVYNIAGQIVKTTEVTENSRLDVSALPKGTYIVTGSVNGQAVSQKIIKK